MARTQYQIIADPLPVPLFQVGIDNSAEVIFAREFQYDTTTIGTPPIIPSFGYFKGLSEPIRFRPQPISAAMIASGLIAPIIPIQPSAFFASGISQPPSQFRKFQYQSQAFVPLLSEAITVDKWFSSFVDVIRSRPFKFTLDAIYFVPLQTEAITLDKWYQNFVPLPNEAFTVSESVVDFIIQLPEIITVDKWFHELSIPQKLAKTFLQSSAQDFVAFTELIPPVTQDWFYYAFSEPVRFKLRLLEALQAYQEGYVYVPGQVTFQDIRWFTALSEPVRYRWFPPAEQQSLLALTIPFNPAVGYADVIVQTWNVLPEVDTWVINLDLTGCDCGD